MAVSVAQRCHPESSPLLDAAGLQARLDRDGFVSIDDVLTAQERAEGIELLDELLADPDREKAAFASQTDVHFGRRDFCPTPADERFLGLYARIALRLAPLLAHYTDANAPVLELSTLTSHPGAAHQYLHRDPAGALCLLIALEDVSAEQGGTVFAPGTQRGTHPETQTGTHPGTQPETQTATQPALDAPSKRDEAKHRAMRLFELRTNLQLFRRNLRTTWRAWRRGDGSMSTAELRARVCSMRPDNHQPNLLRFLTSRRSEFNLLKLLYHSRCGWRFLRQPDDPPYRLIQTEPKAGTVIVYRSDILHAGADNRGTASRRLLNINIATSGANLDGLRNGYSPHATLRKRPLTFGQLLARA